MSYALDLSQWSLEKYKNVIKTGYLIPSQKILLGSIDQYFAILKQRGIETAETLKKELSTKKKVILLAEETEIPENYLIVLRREIQSRVPKPRPLSEYPAITGKLKSAFHTREIKNSIQLYEFFVKSGSIFSAAETLDSEKKEIKQAFDLVNVSRLRYVSPLFATVLVFAGYDSIRAIQKADPVEMCLKMKQTNQGNKWYKGNIGENDMRFLIEDSRLLEDELA